jgi:uncharacterized protein (TIGR00730 family)
MSKKVTKKVVAKKATTTVKKVKSNGSSKIKRARNWTESKANSSWQIFKIMAEFVDGFEALAKIGPCISIFGSARTKPENKYYQLAVQVAEKIAQEGFGVISGGGPGIMEAANRGAFNVGGKSVGLNIELPFEQNSNQYIDRDKNIFFDYFFVRKTIFAKYSQGFIMMPGGFGTMDEFFEVMTLVQTGKMKDTPMILVGKKYWQGLIDWVGSTMLEEGNISPEDVNLFHIVDTAEEVVDYLINFYKKKPLAPNF